MYDYIVIGSGPAGGLIAYNLHSNGANVLLVEAGKLYNKNTFPKDDGRAIAQLYWKGGIELTHSRKLALLRTKVVGGSSIVYQALFFRFFDFAWQKWKSLTNIDFFTPQDMEPYYKKAEEKLTIYTYKYEDLNKNAQYFIKSCNNLGIKWKFLRRGMTDCATNKGNDCIACFFGCHRDSKQSSLVAFIQKALKNNLKLQTETMIEKITHKKDHIIIYGTQKGKKIELKSRKVIVCGGSLGTTHLLLKSDLKKDYPALGKFFTGHPQYMAYGFFDEPINAHKGNFQTVASHDPNLLKQGFKIENIHTTPVPMALFLTTFGKNHQRLMKKFSFLTSMEIAIVDENTGEITIDNKKRLIVKKELTEQDQKAKKLGIETMKNLLYNQGAKEVFISELGFCLHLMGGATIGTNPNNSVVNPEFQMWKHKNIYICDSSIFPAAPGINPSLTIMALAEKLSENLLKL